MPSSLPIPASSPRSIFPNLGCQASGLFNEGHPFLCLPSSLPWGHQVPIMKIGLSRNPILADGSCGQTRGWFIGNNQRKGCFTTASKQDEVCWNRVCRSDGASWNIWVRGLIQSKSQTFFKPRSLLQVKLDIETEHIRNTKAQLFRL